MYKRQEHETHLECHLLVDSSASMGFRDMGPMSKLEYASFFAACFAWLVVREMCIRDRKEADCADEDTFCKA